MLLVTHLFVLFFLPHCIHTLWTKGSSGMGEKRRPKTNAIWTPLTSTSTFHNLPTQPSTAHQFHKGHIFTPFLRNEYPKTSHIIRPQATFAISSALILATSQPHWAPCKPPSSSETFIHTAPSGWNDFDKCLLLPSSTSQALVERHSPYEIFHQARHKHSSVPRQASASQVNYNYLNVTLFTNKL